MSLVPFLAVAFAAGSLSLLTRRSAGASAAIGVTGLLAGLVAASTIRAEPPLLVGGTALAGSAYLRLFLVLGCAGGLLLAVVAAATTWPRNLPGATLLALGAGAVALGVTDPAVSVAAATAGAVAGVLVTLPGTGERAPIVVGRQLRALVAAGALALPAVGVTAAAALSDRPATAGLLGLAYLAFAAAMALRLGAIPFHLWAARVADAAPEVALPLVMAWSPAVFAVVAVGWSEAAVTPLGESLAGERVLIVVFAAATILLGTAAAVVHDDIEHVVGYSMVADAGVALLALAALDAAAWPAARTWLLTFALAKSGFAAWAAAVRATYGTRRLRDLAGWARRAPTLGLGLAAVAVATLGWPGMAVFSARTTLVDTAAAGPVAGILLAVTLASVAIYVRLLLTGIRPPGAIVWAGPDPRPVWPRGGRPVVSIALLRDALDAWSANRAAIAGAAVLVLAALALAIGGGGLGLRDAAEAPTLFGIESAPSPSGAAIR